MKNLFAYKKPDSEHIYAGGSDFFETGIRPGSFVIAPFLLKMEDIISIPLEKKLDISEIGHFLKKYYENSEKTQVSALSDFPDSSTTKEQHSFEVNAIKEAIREGKVQKCIATKVIVEDTSIDPISTFLKLCQSYPYAFVFLFHTPQSGTWIGASPELLLKAENTRLESMSLAGTRPTGTQDSWSVKDRKEQQIVTDFIVGVFKDNGLNPSVQEPITMSAGPVEHLMTKITGQNSSSFSPLNLIKNLSPTPALSGYPQKEAINLILKNENFDRGYYGGFCGWSDEEGNFGFYVNLRSLRYEPDRFCIYAGGGIVEESDENKEWVETENKAKTVLSQLKFKL